MKRSLLVSMVILALVFSLLAFNAHVNQKKVPWPWRFEKYVYRYLSDMGLNAGSVTIANSGMLDITLARANINNLSVLTGLPLKSLDLNETDIDNIVPLHDFTGLICLNLSNTKVSDLKPIAHIPLKELQINGTLIKDLSSITGMPLRYLSIRGISVTNIGVLSKMHIQDIEFSPELLSEDQLNILRKIKFNTINMQGDSAGFWKDWNNKEGQY
ncbi:MAG: hypothetical protein PHO37_10390 [Kiritimatiellae bacterium]|nr:hypothetical protein [Kiritimatiellia bacterium]